MKAIFVDNSQQSPNTKKLMTALEKVVILEQTLDLYEQGDLSAEQAIQVLLIDTGRKPRSGGL